MLPIDIWQDIADYWLEEVGQILFEEPCPSNGYPVRAYLYKDRISKKAEKLSLVFTYEREDSRCHPWYRHDPDIFFEKLDQWCADQSSFFDTFDDVREYLIFQGFDPDTVPTELNLDDDAEHLVKSAA